MSFTDDRYEELATAIVKLGLQDLNTMLWKAEHARNRRIRESYEYDAMVIERELRSPWVTSLTKLDMDVLIKGVKENGHKKLFRTD